nr:MAG TPA: hypothetical protein [Bacteriophage sp.]
MFPLSTIISKDCSLSYRCTRAIFASSNTFICYITSTILGKLTSVFLFNVNFTPILESNNVLIIIRPFYNLI